jgi:nucleotide-binding universal stress UspA family protein
MWQLSLFHVGVIIYTFFGRLKATFFAEHLNSAFIFAVIYKCERIVKLGDPASNIAEVAESNQTDIIITDARGLGNTTSNLGSISDRVVGKTSIPVLLIK